MATLKEAQEATLEKANNILDQEDMTLEEKLEAINKAMQETAIEFNRANPAAAPIDPMDALHCEGCQ